MNKEERQIEREVCIHKINVSKNMLCEYKKEITVLQAKFKNNLDRLIEIKEQIPNFDMETYKKYKEYFSAEDEIEKLRTTIDRIKMQIEETTADISTNEEKVKKYRN